MWHNVIMWCPKVPNSQLLSCFFLDFLRMHRLRQPWWALPLTHEEPAFFECRLVELDWTWWLNRSNRSIARMERWCRSVGKGLGGHLATPCRLHVWCGKWDSSFFADFSRVSMANNLAVKDSFCVSQLNTSLMYFPTPINNTYVGHLQSDHLGTCGSAVFMCTRSDSTWKYTLNTL